MMERRASIDIGTNTVRLLIADADYLKTRRPIHVEKVITRLGGGFGRMGRLEEASIERTLKTLKNFAEVVKRHEVAKVRAVATSVVREACNQEEFLERVAREAEIQVEVIDSIEEARLTLRGVLSVVGEGPLPLMVFDIGGGSTEYIFSAYGLPPKIMSLNLGVVHLTEKFLKSDPTPPEELKALEEAIVPHLLECRLGLCPSPPDGLALVGCGGTVTTLAAMDQGLMVYDPAKVNNYTLTKEAVDRLYRQLASLPIAQRKKIVSLEPGREDIIISGCAIVSKTLDIFGADELKVSDAGLLEGTLLAQLDA